ncbi:cytochrome P450 2J1-like isoform X1 [Conger conger]|uniref:cytochrome P450 2J1-like isoform X1 n=1 Tax=Conger conger TaxID=82655 RepID=UPI002A5A09AF|nr:cytochrome P450 2J1-like isoform X1 [Conger conger]XP_061094508.1 cytochrome P450 2J1-like isoform X1 [Conger conger]
MMAAFSMLSFLELVHGKFCLIFLALFLTLTYVLKQKSPKKFPPGPRSLPFIGDLLRIDSTKIHLHLAKFAEQYGGIYSIHLGTRIVVLHDLKYVKEALIQKGENFVDRPRIPLFEDLNPNHYGVVFSNGYAWKQQRRFALMTLKNFGLGKKSLEPSIQAESKWLSEAFGNEQEAEKFSLDHSKLNYFLFIHLFLVFVVLGRPFDPQFVMNNAVSNVTCCLVFGDRFEYTDRQFQDLLKRINEAVYLEGSIWAQLYNAFPWIMRKVPGPHRKIFEHWDKVISFVKLKIKEHRNDLDPSAPRDYIDCFLAEMEKWKTDVDAGFNEENLCFCTFELFVAGTETTSTTLNWGLLFMIKYPDVQEKVQAEIDHVIGQSRMPSMADRPNMPYTDAVIHEIQRMGNILPLNLARMAVKDTQIGEYIIPKGTMVLGTLSSALFDESEWETPQTFNPGHFLDAEGNFRRRDAFMPFSAGKRVCLGEQLARMELFLFFTSLLQRFTFSPPPGVEPSLEYRMGFTHCPKPYKLCAVPR